MSCHEYRYLIQHRFDEDLDADEVESVDDHIDQCESCQKFEHQLDQMIQGAEEMPLPEELTPPNPEALAKMVQDKLPQQKSSVFSMFTEMFSGGNKQARNKASKDKTEFPKRGKSVGNKREVKSADDSESEEAMSGRLKSLAREPDESRDLQSTTRGLGEKFGFANAPANEANAAPLTLAESIRRKISESQKMSVEDGDMTSEDRLTTPGAPPPGIAPAAAPPPGIAQAGGEQWNAPMKMSGQAQPDAGWTPGGAQPNSWTPNQNQTPPASHPGSAIGLAAPGSDSGWNEDRRPPRGTSAGDENAGWGPPPAGGAWEDPSGGGGQAQSGQDGGGWGAGASSNWATSPSPTQPGVDQFGSGGWNVPSAKENQTSGSASAPAAPAPGWGGGSGGAESWGSSSSPNAQTGAGAVNSWGAPPAAGAAQGQQGGWSDGGSTGGASWDAAKTDTAAGSWAPTNSAPANAGGDSWGTGGGNDSWGAPNTSGAASAESWGTASGAEQQSNSWGGNAQAAAPAPPPSPAPAGDGGWGQPAGGNDQGGWGSGSGQSWGGAAPTAATPAPAQPQAAEQSGWGAPAGTPAANPGGGWGAPPAQAPAAPGATASGDWTATSGEKSGGWGGGAAAAPATPAQSGAPGWGASASQGGWDTQSWEDKSEAKQRGNWSIEAEQMETGTWTSYSGAQGAAGNALGAKPPSPAGQAVSDMSQDRWDTPIQERGAPAAPAPAPAADSSHWDVPIQEKLKGKTDPGTTPPAAPGWGAAAAPAAPAATQGPGESHWDLPIQEKLKQQQAGGGNPYESTPAQPFGQPPAAAESFGSQTGAPPSFGAAQAAPAAPPAFGTAPGTPSAPPAFGAAPGAQDSPPGFGAPSGNAFGAPAGAPGFGAAPGGAPIAPPAFGQPPAETTAPAFGAPPAPSFGQHPAPATPPAPAPAPAAAPAAGGAGLFSKPLDDNAMDQIFDGLGIKESGVQPVQSATPQQATLQQAPNVPQQQPQAPSPGGWGAAAAPAAPAAGGWGAPPAPAGVPDTMSFAPEVPPPAETPRLTAIPPKAPTTETPSPLPAPAPPAMPGMPAPVAAPQVAPVQSKKPGGGMFSLDDDAVDQIFAKIGVEESSIPVNQGAAAPAMPAPATQMPAATPVAPAPPAMSAMPAPPAMSPPTLGQPPVPTGMTQPPAMPNAGAPPAFGMAPPAGMTPPGGMAPPAGFGAAPGGMPAAPMPPQMPAATPQQNKSGLFQVDDNDMDNLFDKVLLNPGSEGATAAVSAQPQAPMGAVPPAFGAPPAPQAGNGQYPPQGAMPGMPPAMPGMPPAMPGMPTSMPGMAMPAQAPEPPAPAAIAHVPPSSPPPKIEGIGKLDASADVTETGSGRIAAIGKFLLDQKDLEKLSKITAADQQDIKMRILTLEASEDLQTLLSEIGGQEKVIGSVIVGHDGLLIANTMPEEVDAESIGVWALGVYMNTEHVTKKMGHERVHQVVSRTPRGYVVIADFGGGLLVTITEGTDTDTLIPLMRKITDLVS